MKATTLIHRGLENGLTITNLSKQLGINANTIYSWKAGKTRPRPKNLAKLNRLVAGTTHTTNTKTVKTRSIKDILGNGNGTGKLVEPVMNHVTSHMSLDDAHWDGFKEGLKRGMEITEDQFRDYGSTR